MGTRFDANHIVLYVQRRQRQRQRERPKSNRLRLAKQQLCTYITLFVHFLAVTTRPRREIS